VVLWSGASVGGTPLRDWPGWDASRENEMAAQVRTAAYEIIRRKGATNHAIGLVTAELLRETMRGERRVLTVSRVQDDASGYGGVALSLPTVVGPEGATRVVVPEMTEDERRRLDHSADVLRDAIASIRG
jgi:L-lactate dehydrogenase